MLVTLEAAEPGEGATFCAIWPASPLLSVCWPPTPWASNSLLMLPMMMMRPPTSLRHRRLLGRSRETVRDGGGEYLADLLRAPAQLKWRYASPSNLRKPPSEGGLRADYFPPLRGSLIGTCREVLFTRGPPSSELVRLMSVSRTKKNFSASTCVSSERLA